MTRLHVVPQEKPNSSFPVHDPIAEEKLPLGIKVFFWAAVIGVLGSIIWALFDEKLLRFLP